MSGGFLWAGVIAGLLGANPQAPPPSPTYEPALESAPRTIRIAGRVTRGGAPAPGLGVAFAKGWFACLLWLSRGTHSGLMATTDQGGRFETIVEGPGNYLACIGDKMTRLPMREVDIPDTDSHYVDLAVEEIVVAGIVVDQASGEPIAHAVVQVASKDGQDHWWVETKAGPDGRFRLGAFAEGECVLEASAKGYARGKLEASLPAGGDLRLALARASTIKGRVVDTDGYGIDGVSVVAVEPVEAESGNSRSLQDGSFEIGFLSPVPHNLCAGSALAGFAVAAEVSPGTEDVLLTLSRGHVRLTVRGPDGAPFTHAAAAIKKVDGLVIGGCPDQTTTSDSRGVLEVATPLGTVELNVYDRILVTGKDRLEATVTVTITPGETAVAAVELALASRDR